MKKQKKRQSLTRLTYKGKTVHAFDVSPEATLCPVDSIVLLVEIMPCTILLYVKRQKWHLPLIQTWRARCITPFTWLCLMPIKAWYGKSCRSINASTRSEIWAGKSPTQIQLANLHVPFPGPKIRTTTPRPFISESQNPMKHSVATSNATSFIKFCSRPPRTPPSGLLQVKPLKKPHGTY